MRNNAVLMKIMVVALILAALPLTMPSEVSAAGPYEYLVLNQSEAGALGLTVDHITDNSADGNIAVHGHYYGLSALTEGIYIHFDVVISRLSPTDDISFETATADCTLCTYPDCVTYTTLNRPCYSRKGDGYTNFGVEQIDRNLVSVGGTSVCSVSGLKITVTTDKIDYGITQAIWDDGKRRHDQFANTIVQKVMTNYVVEAITLTLTPLASEYAPGETVAIGGSVADASDSTPLAGASVTVDVAGTPFSTTTDGGGNFSVDFDIPGDAGMVGYPITVTASSPGYPDATESMGISVGELLQVLSVTVDTDKDAYTLGETAVIQGAVSNDSGPLAGAGVTVNVNGTQLSATTDASGNYRVEFPIPPDVTEAVYTVSATASYSGYPDASKSTSFVVGEIGMHLEENPATGEPFLGVTADGISSLGISISLPGCTNVKVSQPDVGKLEGNAVDTMGNVTLDSTGVAEITYYPPDYLTKDQLTRELDVHQSGSRVWAAEVPLTLTYTDASEQEGKIDAEILACRPPVMLVHGFLGGGQPPGARCPAICRGTSLIPTWANTAPLASL